MSLFRKGNIVEVVTSRHQQLMAGDTGIVEQVMKDGYAVRFHKKFLSAVLEEKEEDRIIFMTDEEIKRVQPRLLDEKLVATLQLLQDRIKNARTKQPPLNR